ncbi:MAG: hypothetical protein Kilf2KO_19810 [Rhodospirillales bacterium]
MTTLVQPDPRSLCPDPHAQRDVKTGRGLLASGAALFRQLGAGLRYGRVRADTRRDLARLDERQLRDIGYLGQDLDLVVEALAEHYRDRHLRY